MNVCVLPGDTFEVKTSKVIRLQTLKTPIMDDIFLDTYYFYIPNRLVWSHWANFLGENSDSAWIPENEYTIPQLTAPDGGWNVGTIADYLGVPPGVSDLSVNALPFRAYAALCDTWFRDQNLSDPLNWSLGDSDVAGSNGSSYVNDVAKGGVPFQACKTHDYFTSCLPQPLKSAPINLSVTASSGILPVFADAYPNSKFGYPTDATSFAKYDAAVKAAYPLQLESAYTYHPTGSNIAWPKFLSGQNGTGGIHYWLSGMQAADSVNMSGSFLQSFVRDKQETPVTHSVVNTNLNAIHSAQTPSVDALTPVNLVADASTMLQSITINELRQAFQIQRFFERSARSGTRYREIIASQFNTQIGDVRAMIPEYLGGNRLPVNVRQITQTSSNVEGQPLGDVAGMSVTNDNHFDFVKSFTEHGYIIGVMVARYNHTYQQGLEPTFLRKTKFDYYWPVFAHLGEMKVPNATLYAQGTDADKEVFGYQEAWAEYRYKPNRVSGMMRSVSASGLDTWHLADNYASQPYLSDSWIREDKSNVDRVLTVSSAVSNQIFADILVTNHTTRPMPLYSIPGLIDHF